MMQGIEFDKHFIVSSDGIVDHRFPPGQ